MLAVPSIHNRPASMGRPSRGSERKAVMVKWGKAIDHRKCIGCHACTVACKSEHLVPLGVTRTYVKQVDVGVYPAVRRHFQVTRCNQCENPPCAAICPVGAMFRRPDGIVDFDRGACVGCKACLAACPYDAIYIDPVSHSAEKCNFCAHRIDQGLEPACVAVCPERAIVVGDLTRPDSEVARLLAREKAMVRKPEKGTRPKVFYVQANQFTLVPGAAAVPAIHAYAEQRERYPAEAGAYKVAATAVLAYDVPHGAPWGWHVSAYTWTKSVAAGAFALPAALGLTGVTAGGPWMPGATMLALAFLALTGLLLIADLKHPERFLNILLRPRWRSWLARGAFIITGYGVVLGLDLLARLGGQAAFVAALRLPGLVLGAMTAIYTAFLFAQARGRDLWQNPTLPLHLLSQAVLAGSGALLLLGLAVPGGEALTGPLTAALVSGLGLHLALALSEAVIPHATRDAARAAHQMVRGAYRGHYRLGVILAAGAVPLALAGGAWALGVAAVMALVGLLVYEHAFVQAGQSVPLS